MNYYGKSNILVDIYEKIVKANRKYIISIDKNIINIYIFENNKIKKVLKEKFVLVNEGLELDKIYDNIFLTISRNIINIFEISESMNNYKLKNKIRIKENDNVRLAKFSEYNEKILGSVTDYNIVRLWNIDEKFNYITIKSKCKLINNLLFNKDENLLIIQGYCGHESYEIYTYDISYEIKVKKQLKRDN